MTKARLLSLTALAILVVGVAAYLLLSRAVPSRASEAAIRRGAYDFATGSCISCHALAGVSTADAAVDLTHEGSRRTYGWLRHEIAYPTSIRPPTPRGQTDDLAAYLASLR